MRSPDRGLAGRTLPDVTIRERAALTLLLVGVVCIVVAAAAFAGWAGAVAAVGVLAVAGGILLGLDDTVMTDLPPFPGIDAGAGDL